jgi:prophage regulatory protein
MSDIPTGPAPRALRLGAVIQRTGLSRSTIYRLGKTGDFPEHKKLSERVSVWDEAAVNAWLAQRLSAPRRPTA